MRPGVKVFLAASLLIVSAGSRAAAPIRVMLLDGESGGPYHNWQATTQVLEKQLDQTGLFQVDVVTAPPAGASFRAFKPDFTKYQAVVLNYDAPDDRWPADLKSAFEQYMSKGGGLVIVHAADNAFPDWSDYNLMIGIGGWLGRNEKSGPYWYYQDGKLVSDPTPGPAVTLVGCYPFYHVGPAPQRFIVRAVPGTRSPVGD